ncbi:hypothetical protein [Paraherbaspirillum soli]|uniref:Polysaccharide chain length determinant N-terminal domain-containing protein n=1 Tax=Paraherbaspirillum soli TaxID=631222 RepID=A0ABW0MB95_9BURK
MNETCATFADPVPLKNYPTATFFLHMNTQADLVKANLRPPLSFFFKRYALTIAISGLLSTAIAVGIAVMLPKQWPATLLFQIGQVGPNQLVDPNNVVQRIRFPGFALQVIQARNLPTEATDSERARLIRTSLSASIAKGSNLIEMSVKGYSPEEAVANLDTAFKILENEHAQLLTPSITRLKKNLDDTASSLKKIEDERLAILEPIAKANSATNIEKKFSESILLTSMLKSNDSEARSLKDQKTAIEEQLSPYRTFNTQAVTSIYVPKKPSYPNKISAAILGFMLGVLGAGIWAMRRDEELRSTFGHFFK